ncbi:MAG: FAD-dependent oxidoreductase [Geminicoccaceae bacterium]
MSELIAVIGAGMAGAACAAALARAGAAVRLFDKGRSIGGRMAQRRVDT